MRFLKALLTLTPRRGRILRLGRAPNLAFLATASRCFTAALTVAGRKGDRGRAQGFEPFGRREPPDPVALEQAIDRRFAHPRRLLRGWDQTPKVQEPGRGDIIGQPEHLRVETPQQLPDAVAEPVALLFQILRH